MEQANEARDPLSGSQVWNRNLIVAFQTPLTTNFLEEKHLTRLAMEELEVAAQKLNEPLGPEPLWEVSDRYLDLQGYGEPLASGLHSQMPRPILRSNLQSARRSLIERAPLHQHEMCNFPGTAGTIWKLLDAEISVWNTGAALVTTRYEVIKDPYKVSWKVFGGLTHELQSLLIEDLRKWRAYALSGFEILAPDVQSRALTRRGPNFADFWSDPLWTFNSFFVMEPPTNRMQLGDIAKALVEDGKECGTVGTGDHLVAYVGLTACLATDLQEPHPLGGVLLRLVGVHTVCWASALALDSAVTARRLAFRFRSSMPTAELDDEAASLIALADKVSFFLLKVEGVSRHLTPEASDVWECLDEEWKFPGQRRDLKDKVEGLRALQGEMIGQIGDRRLRRLNKFVVALTIVGTLSVAPTVSDFFYERSAQTNGVFLVAMGLFLESLAVYRRLWKHGDGRPSAG